MPASSYRYLFGPVPSRRLGRSLGIDLTPHKSCSYNCVFCQLGPTRQPTVRRAPYVSTRAVIKELEHWLESDGQADYLTLSGSGEPTLHAQFGQVLGLLRRQPIPSALLTNGSLLAHRQVRKAATRARVVKVSLSAWDQASFEWVNRPHKDLCFGDVLRGLRQFRDDFNGALWVEVFLLAGINAMPQAVHKIARLVEDLAPDRIDLNTVSRPPAEDFATAVPFEQMEALAEMFHPRARIIGGIPSARSKPLPVDAARILSMLQRRPCTIGQIHTAFGIPNGSISDILERLIRQGTICADIRPTEIYYRVCQSDG